MIIKIILSVLIVFGMLAGWVAVQYLARRFAARHPELGPAREEGEGCGFLCHSKDGQSCRFRRAGFCHEPKEGASDDKFPHQHSTTRGETL